MPKKKRDCRLRRTVDLNYFHVSLRLGNSVSFLFHSSLFPVHHFPSSNIIRKEKERDKEKSESSRDDLSRSKKQKKQKSAVEKSLRSAMDDERDRDRDADTSGDLS